MNYRVRFDLLGMLPFLLPWPGYKFGVLGACHLDDRPRSATAPAGGQGALCLATRTDPGRWTTTNSG